MTQSKQPFIPQRADEGTEADYSYPDGQDFDVQSRDKIFVRSMREDDLRSIVSIDKKITGRDRTSYFERKIVETQDESAVRVSLVAEVEGYPVGFIMARVDFGEFGHTEPEAVMDTIGVNPDFAHHEVGHAMMAQLLGNLRSLQVEKVRTTVQWNSFGLIGFLDHCGFAPAQRLAFTRKL
ncbi:MAG: GNAT family N-acetyltransferase [Rhizobiales bacterium]|nr:GNAT family N-acetyltransferase [Hyphomicrobiales bacterium]